MYWPTTFSKILAPSVSSFHCSATCPIHVDAQNFGGKVFKLLPLFFYMYLCNGNKSRQVKYSWSRGPQTPLISTLLMDHMDRKCVKWRAESSAKLRSGAICFLLILVFPQVKLKIIISPTWVPCTEQFSSPQAFSHVRLFATPWTAAGEASLSIMNPQSLFKCMSIESVMPSNNLILYHLLLLLPSIFPSIRVFSNESALLIRWPKY